MKKIIIIFIPIVIAFIAIFVFIKKQENKGDNFPKAFIPSAEQQKTFLNKTDAYEKEVDQYKKDQRELEASANIDFFSQLTKEEKKQEQELPQDSTKKALTDDELKGLFDKWITDKEEPPTTTKKQKSTPTPKRQDTPKLEAEEDNIHNLYNQAINTGDNNIEPKEEQQEQVTLGKRTRKGVALDNTSSNLLSACIHGDQTIHAGETVRMRLLESVKINNTTIPKNTIFYGTSSFNKDRLSVSVKSLKYANTLLDVNYLIYDNDAILGLNLPESIKAELTKKATDASLNQVPTINSTGVISSAINTTTQVAKSVLRKDIQSLKVHLKGEYKIYIKQ